jgi:uncharacterized NAD(P)/FAD-binding protein YdhS
MPQPLPLEIAIVGAGFSGTLVAVHLLRQTERPVTVHLIERDPSHFARGVAYGTGAGCHLLNVPAGNMSAFPNRLDHFLRWAEARAERLFDPPWVTAVGAKTFLPRRAYGDYLSELLDEAEQEAGGRALLLRRIDKASGLELHTEGVDIRLASGDRVRADKAVLALGNFPPGNPPLADPSFYESRRYHRNPWREGVLDALLQTDACLLVGSGLTMVDWVVSLSEAGYRGTIHVLSRRGLWPEAHRLGQAADFTLAGESPSVRGWLRAVRRRIADDGGDWRPVVDALRPSTQALWSGLSAVEQRRFLRHLRPFWEVHRHRLAPPVAERLHALAEAGRLVRHTGRILACGDSGGGVEVRYRPRRSAGEETFQVGAVVNCSGSDSNYRRLESAFVRDLLRQGLIGPDPLALGLNVAADGALVDARGQASDRLYTLGPSRKGQLWETTAVPELRGQAAALAALLVAG